MAPDDVTRDEIKEVHERVTKSDLRAERTAALVEEGARTAGRIESMQHATQMQIQQNTTDLAVLTSNVDKMVKDNQDMGTVAHEARRVAIEAKSSADRANHRITESVGDKRAPTSVFETEAKDKKKRWTDVRWHLITAGIVLATAWAAKLIIGEFLN